MDEAEILALLIENYEYENYPIEALPVEDKIRMVESNIRQRELIGIIGGNRGVAEILNPTIKVIFGMVKDLKKERKSIASFLVNPSTCTEIP